MTQCSLSPDSADSPRSAAPPRRLDDISAPQKILERRLEQRREEEQEHEHDFDVGLGLVLRLDVGAVERPVLPRVLRVIVELLACGEPTLEFRRNSRRSGTRGGRLEGTAKSSALLLCAARRP